MCKYFFCGSSFSICVVWKWQKLEEINLCSDLNSLSPLLLRSTSSYNFYKIMNNCFIHKCGWQFLLYIKVCSNVATVSIRKTFGSTYLSYVPCERMQISAMLPSLRKPWFQKKKKKMSWSKHQWHSINFWVM